MLHANWDRGVSCAKIDPEASEQDGAAGSSDACNRCDRHLFYHLHVASRATIQSTACDDAFEWPFVGEAQMLAAARQDKWRLWCEERAAPASGACGNDAVDRDDDDDDDDDDVEENVEAGAAGGVGADANPNVPLCALLGTPDDTMRRRKAQWRALAAAGLQSALVADAPVVDMAPNMHVPPSMGSLLGGATFDAASRETAGVKVYCFEYVTQTMRALQRANLSDATDARAVVHISGDYKLYHAVTHEHVALCSRLEFSATAPPVTSTAEAAAAASSSSSSCSSSRLHPNLHPNRLRQVTSLRPSSLPTACPLPTGHW
jgi:hypothetical protein